MSDRIRRALSAPPLAQSSVVPPFTDCHASPEITAPLSSRNLLGVAVLSFANQARVVSTSGPLKLAVNGQPQSDATPDGVGIQNYQPGVSELVIGEGANQRNMKESFGPAPALSGWIAADAARPSIDLLPRVHHYRSSR